MLLVACVLSALAGRFAYLCRPFDHDAAMFVYLGKSVADGDRFCHDVIDNKFPSVGLITSVCWRLFGTNWGAYVVLQTSLAVAAAMFLARCAARTIDDRARLPTLLAGLIYLNFSVAVFGGFQLETIQVFFAVIASCSAIEVLRTGSAADAFVVGLGAGTAAMLKPTGLAPIAGLAVAILWCRPAINPIRVVAAVLVGLAMPLGVCLVYLIRTNIVGDMPELSRQISLYASQTPLVWQEDIFKPLTVLVLAGFGILVRGWVFRRSAPRQATPAPRPVLCFAISWFILEFAGALMQRRMYAYHFLPLAAPAALIFGMLPRRNDPLKLLAALGPIMLFSLIGSFEAMSYPDPRVPVLPTSAYLLQHASPDDRVWQDSMPRLLLETNLRPGSRFPLMFIFGNYDDAARDYTPVLLNDFEHRRPRFVILPADMEAKLKSETTQCAHLARSPVRAANFCYAWREIEKYVKANYVEEVRIRGETIYRRK